MKATVRRLNKRGGYIYIPKKYIGQEVEVIFNKCINTSKECINTSTKELDIDEAEQDFLNKYITSGKNPILKDKAIKQFGSNRVNILLSSIKKK